MKHRTFLSNIIPALFIIFLVSAFISGCKWEYIEPIPPIVDTTTVDTTDTTGTDPTVFFETDIMPIFQTTSDPLCTICHSGSIAPDLSGTKAQVYNILVPAHVDTANPETSTLYISVNDPNAYSTDMTGYLTAAEKADILTWIEEGALDN